MPLLNVEKEPEICIGSFRAKSKFIKPGEKNEYEAVLTNCSPERRNVLISFDIYKYYPTKASAHPQDHHAYYAKWLSFDPYSTELRIRYNWIDDVEFIVKDSPIDCDDKWIGPMKSEGIYSIHLVLIEGDEKTELALFQELTAMDITTGYLREMFGLLDIFRLNEIIVNISDSVSDIMDKKIIILSGNDVDAVNNTIDFFRKYHEKENCNFYLFIPKSDGIKPDEPFILGNEEITYKEALRQSILLCDPSVKKMDLNNLLNSWINGIPMLIPEKSPLRELCSIANSGSFFKDYDTLKSRVNAYLSRQTLAIEKDMQNVCFGLEIYEWIKFLTYLKKYQIIEDL